MTDIAPRVAAIQNVSRLHYAIPLALQRQNMLERVFCEWYSAPWTFSRALSSCVKWLKPALGQRMLDRYHPDLDRSRVISNPWLCLWVLSRRRRFRSDMAYYQWESRQLGRWVERAGLGASNALFGFIRGVDPDVFQHARQQGLVTIGDQMIAPLAVERAAWLQQTQKFPEFVPDKPSPVEEDWADLERRSWESLDAITCASEYVRSGLIAQRVPPERIFVNPYPADLRSFPIVDRRERNGAVMVGFVGQVNLRKGTPYLLKVAQNFDPARVRFVMVGPVDLALGAVERNRGQVEMTGVVPRSQIPQWLAKFDIFLFPSTCEGSAGAVSEAMATGLPVICSPESGSVISHGEDGFIVPFDDVQGMTTCIETLAASADMRLAIGQKAARSIREYSLERFSAKVGVIIRQLLARDRDVPEAKI